MDNYFFRSRDRNHLLVLSRMRGIDQSLILNDWLSFPGTI